MKRVLLPVLCVVLCLQLAGCGKKTCEHDYEVEYERQASYSLEGEIRKVCIYCDDKITETIPKPESPLKVTITGMETVARELEPLVMPDGFEIARPTEYWIIFELEVENVSEQDIESFSGTICINNDGDTLQVSGSYKEAVKAGETVSLSDYGFQVSFTDMSIADNALAYKSIDEIDAEFALSEVEYSS